MSRVLDIILTAALVAVIVLAALLLLEPWQPDITEAVAVHDAQPLDVNDRIIVRWEYPDGTEAMPPREMAVWEYVWLPQSNLNDRLGSYDFVVGYLLTDPEMQGHLERHGLTPDEQAILRSKLGVGN
jgi:hypothetical protein